MDRLERIRQCNEALMRLARSRASSRGKLARAFQEITEVATETIEVARAGIWLYDGKRTRICCQDLYRLDEKVHEHGAVLSAKDFPAYFEALTRGRAIAVDDAHSDPATREFSDIYLTPLGIGAMLDAPILVGGEMVGVVCHEHVGGKRRWSMEDQQFAASVADLAALAIESSERVKLTRKLEETVGELRRHLGQVRALIEVSRSLISVSSIDDVLAKIIDLSKEVMEAEASSLLLLDQESGCLRFHVARGTAAAKLEQLTLRPGQGLAGWVAEQGEPLLIEDAYQDPRFDPTYDEATGFRTGSILTVPLTVKGQVRGVIQVLNKSRGCCFDQQDLSLFESFASLASVALSNAELFEQTQKMAAELREALAQERRLSIEKEKMGAYVPRQVVDEISRNRERKLALGGKTVRATVLFCDIKGFTRLAEHLRPQRVVSFLNEYMTAMTAVIVEFGGIVDKFMGDGIMAVFLSQKRGDNHALRAVKAGVRMQKELGRLKRRWKKQRPEVACLEMRCGINSGPMVAGNIGSETRMDYTVIGDNVNVASRIESNGAGGEVHVSESTYRSVRRFFEARKLKPIQVKNRVRPVQIYAIRVGGPNAL